jgi:decaprenylphospho-beta-D-ribofuranose 2-oxidase
MISLKSPFALQTSWGRTNCSLGVSLDNFEELPGVTAEVRSRGAIPSGRFRSYGDSALNSGGININSNKFKAIEIQADKGIAICGSGVTIGELEYAAHLYGLLPAVVPGTGYVTLGGAFASDIHGKSQQTKGNFSDHVEQITLIDRNGIAQNYTPETAEFKATAGGMGLTGFISELHINLEAVETPIIFQKEIRVKSLKEMLSSLLKLEDEFPFTVAWIDLSGKYDGRGVVIGGRYASKDEINKKHKLDYGFKKEDKVFAIPFLGSVNFMRKYTIRAFNAFWYRKPVKQGLISYRKFMHPLDLISNWNLLYGKSGFIQYQFVIPSLESDFLEEVLLILREFEISSAVTVLKRFGRGGIGYLSFPIPGWTLAMDFPAGTKNLAKAIEILNMKLIASGGRIYLTKDSLLNVDDMKSMYKNLEEWKNLKRKMDPSCFWQSDQSRRLELC